MANAYYNAPEPAQKNPVQSLKDIASSPSMQKRFADVLGDKNASPVAVVLCTTSVALIYNNEVKEVLLEQLGIMVFFTTITYKLLIKGEIDFIGSDCSWVILGYIYLMNGLFQRGEILLYGLVCQNVSVAKVENLSLHSTLQEPIYNLECGICLSSSSRHNKKKPLLSLCYSIQSSVDCYSLIIPWGVGLLA